MNAHRLFRLAVQVGLAGLVGSAMAATPLSKAEVITLLSGSKGTLRFTDLSTHGSALVEYGADGRYTNAHTGVESDKAAGTLRAEKGVGLTTWGEVVGIFIRPPRSGAAVYTVEVLSLKRSQLQVTGQDWTTTIISGMKAELDQ